MDWQSPANDLTKTRYQFTKCQHYQKQPARIGILKSLRNLGHGITLGITQGAGLKPLNNAGS
jgi:hypothetical protein